MADENTEEKKKGGILKLLMFIGGGILLIGIGLGVGFFLFGGKPADPSAEIEEIIERKMKEAEEAKAAEEAANADPDKKIAPEVENFVTTYYEFSGTFTTILGMMSEFSEEEIQGKAGRDALSAAIAEAINKKLIELEDFGGVESVHFTSFMLQ